MKKVRGGRERRRKALGYVNRKVSLPIEGPGMVALGTPLQRSCLENPIDG